MPQLSLYLDQPSMDLRRTRSEQAHVSLSKYAAALIQQDEARTQWPAGYWENVYGSIADEALTAPSELDPGLDDEAVFDWN